MEHHFIPHLIKSWFGGDGESKGGYIAAKREAQRRKAYIERQEARREARRVEALEYERAEFAKAIKKLGTDQCARCSEEFNSYYDAPSDVRSGWCRSCRQWHAFHIE